VSRNNFVFQTMGSCQSSASAADATATHRKCATNNSASKGNEAYGTAKDGKSAIRTCRSGESNKRTNIEKWKDELEATGNLTQTVVNIETSSTKRVEDFYDGIHKGPILGTGAAGIVRKCTHRETGIDFAVKCLNIGLIESDSILEALKEEIFIMCQADHPDILRLEEVYASDSQIYMILSLLTGGDMFDRLEEQPDYHYSEVQCAHIVKQMIGAVRYLHSNKIIHRDLKLENFLFNDKDSDNIRLIDFGLSKHFDHDGDKHSLAVGTPYTVAPEIIEGEYDEKVDVWALGVITYLLLCGDPPFGGMDGESLKTIKQNILDCNIVFEPKNIWDGISGEAKHFVRRLLTKDPEKRPSASEAQHDEWLVTCATLDVFQSKPLNPDLVKNLIKFKDNSNLQKILLEVVSFTLLPEQIKDLRQEFEKLDCDGSGEITLQEMKDVLLSNYSYRNGSDRTLTEEEVELIFNSLNLNTKETTIKWHKFITAGLSRCDYDDRNLRLAFNRLDHTGKGFITINDLNGMLRSNDGSMDEMILEMWKDGMKYVRCKIKDRIYFDDFQCFFKGQIPKQKQQGGSSISSIDEINGENSGRWNSNNTTTRMSMNSTRLLASTLSLGIGVKKFEIDVTASETTRGFVVDDDKVGGDRILPPTNGVTFDSMPFQCGSRGCAVLISSRSVGVLE